ncbi:MAG: protein yceI precursor [Rickettsiales bacterium]|nr:protein yceI precursor [Rickettsiales bacterium]|tara:strand:+ start:1734 stop:2327 length:594 start_codon:yes stop_codon:yes gene_type:complete
MKRFQFSLVLLLSLALSGPVVASDWTIDRSHTSVQFKIRHMMVSWVRGNFDKVSGTVFLDHKNLAASKVNVTIEAASVDTDNERRDKHLRNEDFFDVEKYPEITFVSREARSVSKDSFELVGDLTLHGTTREVVMVVKDVAAPVKSPWGGLKSGASASFEIRRSDFGMTYQKPLASGGLVVGDEVKINIDVELNGPK